MTSPKVVLVIGFGNLGAKLLALRWAFPFLRFAFIEQRGDYFREMRRVFRRAGTLRDLMEMRDKDLHPNLKAFRDALIQTPHTNFDSPENLRLRMVDLFDDHVHYGGNEEELPSGQAFKDLRTRYRELIRRLVEYDRSEVLLYLATRPELYLESLKQYSFFANCVAIDKPLAKDDQSLRQMRRFAQINRDLTIIPIDHYLFKLDFTEFMHELERRGGLNPREVQRLDVTICEEELDEARPYFRETGIIRDMMPHVAAMVSLLFGDYRVKQASVGNVTPFIHYYNSKDKARGASSRPGSRITKKEPVIVQARIELNYWTSEGSLPVSVRIAKGAKSVRERRKEIVITWHTGQRTPINLARKARKGEYADWAGALRYLMGDWPLLEPMRTHFTFERACDITADVLACQKQADLKIPPFPEAKARCTFYSYPATRTQPPTVFIFNFDGVVINTETAHIKAWQAWHEVIGHDGPNLRDQDWYEPGKPNREMVSKALTRLYIKDDSAANFALQYCESYTRLFHHILRGEKLQKLEQSLPGKGGPASEYHENVLDFLRLLRQFNQHIVLVTTNHALLVQQTLAQLLNPDEDGTPVGFDRYCVGQRKGLDAYDEIIKDSRRKWGKRVKFVIFDDYINSLEFLQKRYASKDGPIRLIHMDTMENVGKHEKKRVGAIERHNNFQKLFADFSKEFKMKVN